MKYYQHIHHNPRDRREQRWYLALKRHKRTRQPVYSAIYRMVRSRHLARRVRLMAALWPAAVADRRDATP